jgi:hypothetical protein
MEYAVRSRDDSRSPFGEGTADQIERFAEPELPMLTVGVEGFFPA